MARISRFFIILLMGLILLTACSQQKSYVFVVNPSRDPEATKQLKAPALIKSLNRQGVQVVQIGDTLRIILPSDMIFNPRSANFSSGSRVLDNVAYLMLMLRTTQAEVAGFTNAMPAQAARALSLRQAQVVANYLWERGIDSRILYAVGYGTSEPMSSVPVDPANRRVEIRFQFLHYGVGRY
ncbi:MAG TPA: OmpA family protein [Gammaproteobacteria bacterium]|nr:OmpA family protein [Gammaproteobacteria bacterium]